MISTAALLGDDLLALLPTGIELQMDAGTCVAQYLDQETHLFLPPADGAPFALPGEGTHYAIFRGEQRMEFGMAQLGAYTVNEAFGRSFLLGLNGAFALRFAHSIGIRKLLDGRTPESMSLRDVYDFLLPRLRDAVIEAISRINGPGPWRYENLSPRIPELSRACWEELFPIFYEHGLLLPGRQFQIKGITRPTIEY